MITIYEPSIEYIRFQFGNRNNWYRYQEAKFAKEQQMFFELLKLGIMIYLKFRDWDINGT